MRAGTCSRESPTQKSFFGCLPRYALENIGIVKHILHAGNFAAANSRRTGEAMAWAIEFHSDFGLEFVFSDSVMVEVLALAELLREEGPDLNRPHADTLKGSRHSDMKELRCRGACKTWRVAFCLHADARGAAFGGRRQVRHKREAILQEPDQEGRHTVRPIPDRNDQQRDRCQ